MISFEVVRCACDIIRILYDIGTIFVVDFNRVYYIGGQSRIFICLIIICQWLNIIL